MVECSSVRSIISSKGIAWPARLVPMFFRQFLRSVPHMSDWSADRAYALLRVAVDDGAEQLPIRSGEARHLHLLDRIEIGRRGLDADARKIVANLEIHVGDDLHDVLAR